jgi:hypothetical protein
MSELPPRGAAAAVLISFSSRLAVPLSRDGGDAAVGKSPRVGAALRPPVDDPGRLI